MIALAAVAVTVGAGLGVLTVQRLEVGETWEEWRDADSPGWFTVLQVVLIAMFLGGIFLRPVELAAVLIGIPGGFCLVYFSIGIRRRFGKSTGPRPVEPEPEPEERESLRSHLAWLGATFAISLAVGFLLIDLRGVELVAVAAAITLVTRLGELLRDRLSRRLLGR